MRKTLDNLAGRRRPGRVSSLSAFTLIELLIVVVLIGLLSAVAIPYFISSKDEASKRIALEKKEAAKTQGQDKTSLDRVLERVAILQSAKPSIVSAEMTIRLAASIHQYRWEVITLFDADYQGAYTFVNEDPEKGDVTLYFPFPAGTSRARNASLKILGANGEFSEPDGVEYSLNGISWTGPLPRGKAMEAMVTFGAQGYETFQFEGPGAGRAGAFRLELFVKGAKEIIPQEALAPTNVEPGHIVWDYKNLVTDRRIIVELPGAISPKGRINLLFQLAGWAVLLFGLCFWYVSVLDKPGSLDDFRWSHFLLLALNYFLFFIIFTSLSLFGSISPAPALVISAGISLPLLALHIARIMSARFAFRYALPIAVFTLGVIVTGVYGGEYMYYIFTAMFTFALGFLTYTFKEWYEGLVAYDKAIQQEHEEEEAERKKRKREDEELGKFKSFWRKEAGKTLVRLDGLLKESEKKSSSSLRPGAEDESSEMAAIRDRVAALASELSGLRLENLSLYNDLEFSLERAQTVNDREEYLGQIRLIMDKGKQAADTLQAGIRKLIDETRKLEDKRRAAHISSKDKEEAHCIFCGAKGGDSAYCPSCGAQRPLALECAGCRRTTSLPTAILDSQRDLSGVGLHCPSCGRRLDHSFQKPASKPPSELGSLLERLLGGKEKG